MILFGITFLTNTRPKIIFIKNMKISLVEHSLVFFCFFLYIKPPLFPLVVVGFCGCIVVIDLKLLIITTTNTAATKRVSTATA